MRISYLCTSIKLDIMEKDLEFRKDIQDDITKGEFPKAMKSLSPTKKSNAQKTKKTLSKEQLITGKELPKSEEEGCFF
jgi:hypothetical protein